MEGNFPIYVLAVLIIICSTFHTFQVILLLKSTLSGRKHDFYHQGSTTSITIFFTVLGIVLLYFRMKTGLDLKGFGLLLIHVGLFSNTICIIASLLSVYLLNVKKHHKNKKEEMEEPKLYPYQTALLDEIEQKRVAILFVYKNVLEPEEKHMLKITIPKDLERITQAIIYYSGDDKNEKIKRTYVNSFAEISDKLGEMRKEFQRRLETQEEVNVKKILHKYKK